MAGKTVAQSHGSIPSGRKTSDDPRSATTLERGLAILTAFRSTDDGPLANRELAERTGLAKATVSRLTYTLAKSGFLIQDRKHGFSLGPAVLGPAFVFYARLDIRRIARPLMRKLATRPGVYLSLGTGYDLWVISLESVTADWHAPLTGLFNLRTPMAHSAVGHAYMAALPESERSALADALRKRHNREQWLSIKQELDAGMAEIARQGYCIATNELHSMLSAVAAPIHAGNLILTLSAGGASHLLPPEELHRIGRHLVEVAREIERAAGSYHRGHEDTD